MLYSMTSVPPGSQDFTVVLTRGDGESYGFSIKGRDNEPSYISKIRPGTPAALCGWVKGVARRLLLYI